MRGVEAHLRTCDQGANSTGPCLTDVCMRVATLWVDSRQCMLTSTWLSHDCARIRSARGVKVDDALQASAKWRLCVSRSSLSHWKWSKNLRISNGFLGFWSKEGHAGRLKDQPSPQQVQIVQAKIQDCRQQIHKNHPEALSTSKPGGFFPILQDGAFGLIFQKS